MGLLPLSHADFFARSPWNAVGSRGSNHRSRKARPDAGRGADAQKRVPTTTCLHLRAYTNLPPNVQETHEGHAAREAVHLTDTRDRTHDAAIRVPSCSCVVFVVGLIVAVWKSDWYYSPSSASSTGNFCVTAGQGCSLGADWVADDCRFCVYTTLAGRLNPVGQQVCSS